MATALVVDKEIESYDLIVKHVRPDGQGTDVNLTSVTGIDVDFGESVQTDAQGTAKLRLPKGKYFLDGALADDAGRVYQLVWPTLVLDRATTATVDARRAKPVKMTLPKADAKLAQAEFGYERRIADFALTNNIYAPDLAKFFVGSVGQAPTAEMLSYVYSRWGVPGKDGTFRNSPYSYDLLKGVRGGYFNGYSRVVQDRELAKVVSQYHADHPGDLADVARFGLLPGMESSSTGQPFRYDLPARPVQYVESTGTAWAANFEALRLRPDGEVDYPLGLTAQERSYKPGKTYTERWAAAVPAPGLSDGDGSIRDGNDLSVFMFPSSDPDGHAGLSITFDSAITRLYRDNKLVASEEWPGQLWAENLPAGKASYRLETSQRRSLLQLAPWMQSVWTFTSQNTGTAKVVLPLRSTQFQPAVDPNNSVARKPVSKVPFKVMHQPGAKVAPIKKVEVQVSGDGGTTWRKAAVLPRSDGTFEAIFATPKDAKLISLKSLVIDKDGNTSAQTVISAYRLR